MRKQEQISTCLKEGNAEGQGHLEGPQQTTECNLELVSNTNGVKLRLRLVLTLKSMHMRERTVTVKGKVGVEIS